MPDCCYVRLKSSQVPDVQVVSIEKQNTQQQAQNTYIEVRFRLFDSEFSRQYWKYRKYFGKPDSW
jgi:hypothetical protein